MGSGAPERAKDHLESADRLFSEALDLPPSAREKYVLEAPGFSSGLRNSVLKLLSRFQDIGDFLERPAAGPSDPAVREFTPGTTLAGRFLIAERIGRGGMGDVYLAEDRVLGEKVALKTIRAEWRGDLSVLARFCDEIKLARRIAHPNICRIYDFFSEAGPDGSQIAFFTMEHLEGESLADALHRLGRFQPADALRIGRAVAAGLDAAHRGGIIHRDLKPSNIILAADGSRPVITDFGLAKPLAGPTDSSTQTGMIVGSPDYMAPEQFLGDALSPKVDIFALAMVFYEMCTGTRPWPSDTFLRAAMRRISEAPRTLREVAPDLPVRWDRILRGALSPDLERRPESAGALISALAEEDSLVVAAVSRIGTPRLSRRTWIVGGATTLSVSGLVALYRLYDRAPPESPVVMLAPVTSVTSPPAAQSLGLLFEQSLQQSAHVTVLSRAKIAAAWARMGRAALPTAFTPVEVREIALRAFADYVLFCDLAWANGEWAIRANLERTGNSPLRPRYATVRRFYAVDERGLITAAAQAVDWIRGACGETPGQIAARSRPPEEVTTNSWEALKEYTAGIDAWRNRPTDREMPPDQRRAAEDHLMRALELDPQFARAAAALADIQVASRQYDEGLLNYERAANLIDRRNLTDRESLSIRGMFALDTGQYAKAQQTFARYAEEYPDTGVPLFHEARAVECQGNLEGSLHLLDLAVKKEPANYTYTIDRGIRYLLLGRFAEAQKDCDRAAKKNPSDWVDQTRAALAFAGNDLKAVWNALEHMKANGSVSYRSKACLLQACLRAEQNRTEDAHRLFEEGLQFDRAYNVPPTASVRKQQLLASLLASRGSKREAVKICQEILQSQPGLRPTLETGAILAQAGELKTARACLPKGVPLIPPASVPQSLGPGAARQLMEWPVYFRRILRLWAELALAEGDAKTALRLMASAPPPESIQEWPDVLVRASIASGERVTAEGKLAALFRNPAAYWIAPDNSPPGFMRNAIAQARELGMPKAVWRPLEMLLNQNTK